MDVAVSLYATPPREGESSPPASSHVLTATLQVTADDAINREAGGIGVLGALARGPTSLIVQARIHWQALFLAGKGCPFVPNTTLPHGQTAPMLIERASAFVVCAFLLVFGRFGVGLLPDLLALAIAVATAAVLQATAMVLPRTITGRTA